MHTCVTEQEGAGSLPRIKFAPLYVLSLVWAPARTHCTSLCAQMSGWASRAPCLLHPFVCVHETDPVRCQRVWQGCVCIQTDTYFYIYIPFCIYIAHTYSQTHTYIHTETYFYAFICSCTFLHALPGAAISVILLLEASSQQQALDFIWL